MALQDHELLFHLTGVGAHHTRTTATAKLVAFCNLQACFLLKVSVPVEDLR